MENLFSAKKCLPLNNNGKIFRCTYLPKISLKTSLKTTFIMFCPVDCLVVVFDGSCLAF